MTPEGQHCRTKGPKLVEPEAICWCWLARCGLYRLRCRTWEGLAAVELVLAQSGAGKVETNPSPPRLQLNG
eukprot:CAMPEP_0115052296 /NCGR_PEP_ID=MMETSP0227-20121206/2850_1 /TAXON_ID=89957 /ORGANISM="Polarella glacialis, Strain CCMP 1383" /LENGTH=70 /DNA_ID=CAMNT_0002436425 /DNA_START=28 /DNA_END=236 /DNA_ORIENTATION=-